MTAAKLFARTERTLESESPKQLSKVKFQNPRTNRQARGSIWSRRQPSVELSKQFDAISLISNKNKTSASTQSTNSWIPLTKTPSEILITENVKFKNPHPIMKRTFLNPKKHCTFHDDIGHNTDECVTLRNEIEVAVKSGKLEHLVKNVRQGV